MLPFRSLDPFRPLREPDRRRRDLALMPTDRMGPPPGASPPMHDCIMVRIKRSYRIQVCGTKICRQWRTPLDLQPDSFGCVPLRFVFGGLRRSSTQIRPRIPVVKPGDQGRRTLPSGSPLTLAPVHDDATIDEAVAALAREPGGLFDRSRCGLGFGAPRSSCDSPLEGDGLELSVPRQESLGFP